MARIRTIKPDFWTDEKIVQLPFEARLLFIGLWNLADDEGKLEYNPVRIRYQLFPADNIDVKDLLDKLSATGLILIYSVEQKSYIYISHFLQHQKVSHPAISTIPNPGEASRSLARKAETSAVRIKSSPKESKPEDNSKIPIKTIYGVCNNVTLTDEEHLKLAEQFGEAGTIERIDNLSTYIASKGDKYKSHYATIINWDNRDKQKTIAPAASPVSAGMKMMK